MSKRLQDGGSGVGVSATGGPAIVFVDHTTENGGAELALARLLGTAARDDTWVVIPRGDWGAYEQLPVGVVRAVGPVQPAGASSRRVAVIRMIRIALGALRFARCLRRDQAFRSARVVCANTSRAAVLVWLAQLGTGRPYVVYLRDAVARESLGPAGYAVMARRVLPKAAGVIANSAYTLMQADLPPSTDRRTLVVPSPIGIERLAVPRADGPVRRVGMVARLHPWKGQGLLLEAFLRAFGGTQVELHLAGAEVLGGGGFGAELSARAERLGIARQLVLHGQVNNVAAFIDEMDICVQASCRAEPLGQNVLQYLARGALVVVADEGGPTEWVRDGINGLRVEPRSPAALSSALVRLASDPTLRGRLRLGAAATHLLTDAECASRTFGFLSTWLEEGAPQ